MNKAGPIVILEDDNDDIEIYRSIFAELKIENDIQVFNSGEQILDYLHTDVKPFLIISDVNMPQTNGFQIRSTINTEPNIHKKCIPYLFFTTDISPDIVEKAYMLS